MTGGRVRVDVALILLKFALDASRSRIGPMGSCARRVIGVEDNPHVIAN